MKGNKILIALIALLTITVAVIIFIKLEDDTIADNDTIQETAPASAYAYTGPAATEPITLTVTKVWSDEGDQSSTVSLRVFQDEKVNVAAVFTLLMCGLFFCVAISILRAKIPPLNWKRSSQQ